MIGNATPGYTLGKAGNDRVVEIKQRRDGPEENVRDQIAFECTMILIERDVYGAPAEERFGGAEHENH